MPLFEVAIMELPSKKEIEENGAIEKLAFGPEFVVSLEVDKKDRGLCADGKKTDSTFKRVDVAVFRARALGEIHLGRHR